VFADVLLGSFRFLGTFPWAPASPSPAVGASPESSPDYNSFSLSSSYPYPAAGLSSGVDGPFFFISLPSFEVGDYEGAF